MAQEFSKLNGYQVKDATAREQIGALDTRVGQNATNIGTLTTKANTNAQNITALQTAKGQMEGNISTLAERVTDIENTTYNYLSSESTAEDFNNAIEEYNSHAIPIVYFDDVDTCNLAALTDSEDTAPVLYFVNAREKKIIEVVANGSTLNVTEKNLDNPISVSYANEELTIGE